MEHVRLEKTDQRIFLVYTLTEEEVLDPVILGMMENNTIQGLLSVSSIQKDEQQILKYDISGMSLLTDFLNRNRDGIKLVLLLKDLSDILIRAKEYMIEDTAFLFGLHSVFISRDGKGRLLCLPVENRKGVTFQQFCSCLMNQPDIAGRLGRSIFTQINTCLQSRSFSLKDFSVLLDRLELQSAVSEPALRTAGQKASQKTHGPIVLGQKALQKTAAQNRSGQAELGKKMAQKATGPVVLGKNDRIKPGVQEAGRTSMGAVLNRRPQSISVRGYLYRKSSNEKIEIDRPQFRIGKSSENTDYCISDNPSVSRRHAVVIRRGDTFYIEDAGSLNHTYVNQRMLLKGQSAALENGTTVRFSKEEFIFLTEKDESGKRYG